MLFQACVPDVGSTKIRVVLQVACGICASVMAASTSGLREVELMSDTSRGSTCVV